VTGRRTLITIGVVLLTLALLGVMLDAVRRLRQLVPDA